MAGYDGYSMSWNAVYAYDDGLLPASKLAKKLGVSTRAIKKHLQPVEWHHTSAAYNRTYFYNPDGVTPELIEKMKEYDKNRTPAPVLYKNCTIRYHEWEGPVGRKRRVYYTMEHCDVYFNGSAMCRITSREFKGLEFVKKFAAVKIIECEERVEGLVSDCPGPCPAPEAIAQ
jgi:hypothetical protein